MIEKHLWQEGKKEKGFLLGTIVSGFLSGLFGIAQAYLLAYIIVKVYQGDMTVSAVISPLLVFFGIIVLRGFCHWLEEYFGLKLGNAVEESLRHQVLEKIRSLGPVAMKDIRRGEIITLLTEGLETLETYFKKYQPQLFKSAILPLVFLVIVFPQDYVTGIIMVITAPLVPIFMSLIGQWTKVQTKKQWRVLSALGGYFQDVLEGFTTIKLLNRSDEQESKIDAASDRFRSVSLKVLRWAFLSALVLELLTTLSIALIAVGLGIRLVEGTMEFQTALFLLFIAPEFYLPLRSLGTQYHNSLNGVEAAKDIFAFLETESQQEKVGSEILPKESPSLCFSDISFAYEENSPALNGLSFTLPPQKKLGIIGSSGSGKTTILRLLLGYITPQRGEILINDIPLSALEKESLMERIAVISQSPYVFRGTIMENIQMGRNNSTSEDVKKICEEIGAAAFIEKLPQGYDTLIGEGGQRLSGGEKQLLAIARGCLKEAVLVLMDEATKNLDLEKDLSVQRALAYLTKDKTTIAIAHRLQTLEQMDYIMVVEDGRLKLWDTPKAMPSVFGKEGFDAPIS